MIRSVKSFDLKHKRILIRVDFNVPMENEIVMDDFRIRSAIPTIKFCLSAGASVILMSHLGRPKGKVVPELSLIPVGEKLAELMEMPIKFSDDCVSEDATNVSFGLHPGEIHLLENLRFHDGETENSIEFSSKLAKHGQIYINDAFGTAHRAHASNTGVTRYFTHKGIGFLVDKELQYLEKVIQNPKSPLVLVLGGAKIASKLGLIQKFIEEADTILIGGGMAFTFLKARGVPVGGSLVDDKMIETAKRILRSARNQKVELVFPDDVTIAQEISESALQSVSQINKIPDDQMGLDIGPDTTLKFAEIIKNAGTVIWNGPMGVFETPGYEKGSLGVAQALAELHENEGIAVVGGGDTAAAVEQFDLSNEMSHVSTGGGASLELLSGNKLPAIAALES